MKRIGCLAFLVVLIFGALGAYRAFFPPRVGGAAWSQLPPQTQKQRRAEAQKLVEKVEEIARDAHKNKNKTFEITASEDQLNTLLQDRLRTEKFPISDLRAGLTPGVLILQGQLKYQGFEVPASLSGSLAAQNGALIYRIDSLSISGLPAPGKVKEKAQKAIEDGLQKAFGSEKNAKIESVTIGQGQLQIAGKTG
ncbi:hypothetical protein B1R32_102227 [Abditibacterium utsteinense]|uniref:DUF2993 domain-containing protein n=1 Tax=Abditibacterium utsteinense TaxID=1960156 RepID=A0A2S8SWP2_9BACT|nr:hypothetical protein [Abditibacterium utsteinense]PQV65218.1 hypothetical protein B1R32_102227 [Abditibacterium utsteinense]